MANVMIRTCECMYNTDHSSNFARHRKNCKARLIILGLKRELEVVRLENIELKAEIESLQHEAAAVVLHNSPTVPVVNVGNEVYADITGQMFAGFLSHPVTGIGSIYRHMRRKPCNRNILIPNKREQVVKAFVGNEWVLRERKSFLQQVVHMLADRIALEMDSNEVRTLINIETIACWEKYHDSICNAANVMAEAVTQLELVILGERI